MTSFHGATPTVNSRCTNPTRVHRSWLRVHEFTTSMERCFTARELVNSWTRVHDLNGTQHYLLVLVDVGRRVQCELLLTHSRSVPDDSWMYSPYLPWPHCLIARSSGVQLSDWRNSFVDPGDTSQFVAMTSCVVVTCIWREELATADF